MGPTNEDPTRTRDRPGPPAHGNIGPDDPHADPATDPALRPVGVPVSEQPTTPTGSSPGSGRGAWPTHDEDPTVAVADPADGDDAGSAPTVALPGPGAGPRGTDAPVDPRTGLLPPALAHSRTGGLWTGLIASAIVLIFLLIFILQNQDQVRISFLGLMGTLPLGVAMLLSAVAGLLLVAIPGGLRILQLRRLARRPRR